MTILPFTVDGRHGRYTEVGDGMIKMYFDDGEIRYAIPSSMADHRGSITQDSNPEGINQYNSAAVAAKSASNKAAKLSSTTSEHAKAAAAHTKAAEAHRNAAEKAKATGNNFPVRGHEEKAAYHEKAAELETRRSGSTKDSALDAASITKRDDVSAKAGEREYGDVAFADPKNNKYPLDTPEHVRAAASYFGMTKNRSQYGKEDQTKIDKRISAAERKFKLGKFAEGK